MPLITLDEVRNRGRRFLLDHDLVAPEKQVWDNRLAGVGAGGMAGLGLLAALRGRPRAMFGKGIAQAARRNGIDVVAPRAREIRALLKDNDISKVKDVPGMLRSLLATKGDTVTGVDFNSVTRLLRRFGHKNVNFIEPGMADDAASRGRVVLDLVNPLRGSEPSNLIGRTHAQTIFKSPDKFKEVEALRGVMPESQLLSKLIQGRSVRTRRQLMNLMDQQYGKNQWYIKKRDSKQMRGVLSPHHMQSKTWRDDALDPIRNPSHYFVQQGIPSQAYSKPTLFMDEVLSGGLKFKDMNRRGLRKWNRSMDNALKDGMSYRKVYRADLLDGRLVPGSTGPKLHQAEFLPFMSREGRRAQQFAAGVARQLPKDKRRGLMGLDIGIGTDGKPFLIELNPSRAGKIHEASGSLTSPRFLDSTLSGITGTRSMVNRLQVGGTTAGGGLLGTYAGLQ
jgi:hypothetical protein